MFRTWSVEVGKCDERTLKNYVEGIYSMSLILVTYGGVEV